MKKLTLVIGICVVLLVIYLIVKPPPAASPSPKQSTTIKTSDKLKTSMKITSPAFADHQKMPSKFTCDGANVNPPLEISGVPKEAKSLVLIMDDPDAGNTWVHWIVFDMDPFTTVLAEDSKPESGIEGVTSFGKSGYGGACPPSGTHRYFFKLYALDVSLELPITADKVSIEDHIQGHVLERAELVGLYSRTQ